MGTAAISYGPKLNLLNNSAIGEQYYDELRPFLRGMDALIQANVLDWSITNPPVSPNDGDAYILAMSGFTDEWTGHDNQIAVWSTQITDSGGNTLDPGWDFYTPKSGWIVYSNSPTLSGFFFFSGTSWIDPSTSIPYTLLASNTALYDNLANGGSFGSFVFTLGSGSIILSSGNGSTGGSIHINDTSGATIESIAGALVGVKGTQVLTAGGSIVEPGEATLTPTPSVLDITKSSYWLVNSSGSLTSTTLPAISSAPVLGSFLATIKLIGTTPFTINAAGSDTIEGLSSYVLSAQYKYVTLLSFTPTGGSPTWFVVGSN